MAVPLNPEDRCYQRATNDRELQVGWRTDQPQQQPRSDFQIFSWDT